MNLEEINKWLEKEEGMSYTRLEELHDFFYERYTNLNCILSELEEWLKEQEIEYPSYYWDLKNKIQELKEKYK